MDQNYSGEELLEFLSHAGERGLMPAATAGALAVASRQVLGILSADERRDVRSLDPAAVVRRFGNKRAKDFNPSSLKEYGRRFQRAIAMFLQWREHPAAFSVRTRATAAAGRKWGSASEPARLEEVSTQEESALTLTPSAHNTGFQSAFPVRPGTVVTISNIPADLTRAEAERLAQFVKMLALER